jgi:lysozyme family protein
MAVPTSHDRSFIPYPLGADPKFEKCLPDTEIQEGVPWASGPGPAKAFSNDAHDPGGMTMEGIIQREYDLKRRQWGLPTQPVRNISKDEERTIYYTDYWQPYCPLLPAGLDLEFFDLDVNGGQHRAVVTLQRALGVTDDGQFGNQTDAAVRDVVAQGSDGVDRLIEAFKVFREKFYESLSTFRYFGKDWIRRSEEIDAEGEAMEKQASASSGLDQALDDFTNHPPASIMKDEPT